MVYDSPTKKFPPRTTTIISPRQELLRAQPYLDLPAYLSSPFHQAPPYMEHYAQSYQNPHAHYYPYTSQVEHAYQIDQSYQGNFDESFQITYDGNDETPPTPASSISTPSEQSQSHQYQLSHNNMQKVNSKFTVEFLSRMKSKSSSRSNFATNLVRELFDENVRAHSNISGKMNKDQLDPVKINEIKQATFHMFPLGYGENKEMAWKKCHVAIDESCRRLRRK